MTGVELCNAIVRHVGVDNFADWYVGIASDVQARLFRDHHVNQASTTWCHGEAFDSDEARAAESMLLSLGFDGGGGGGNYATVHVYAFRKDLGTVR